MQWNLGIARELTSTLSLTIGYVGSRGVHLPYRVDNIDMVLPRLTPTGYVFPPTATSTTLNPNFGRINSTLWQASSFYDALQADVTKRVSHGVELHGAYTWGKSIDTLIRNRSGRLPFPMVCSISCSLISALRAGSPTLTSHKLSC